jgi:hypothetical protein
VKYINAVIEASKGKLAQIGVQPKMQARWSRLTIHQWMWSILLAWSVHVVNAPTARGKAWGSSRADRAARNNKSAGFVKTIMLTWQTIGVALVSEDSLPQPHITPRSEVNPTPREAILHPKNSTLGIRRLLVYTRTPYFALS